MSTGAAGSQRTLADLAAEARGPAPPSEADRRADRARTRRAVAAHEDHASLERRAALDRLRAAFDQFVQRLDRGAEFQAAEFSTWLHETRQWPACLDGRAVSAVISWARREGLIAPCGFATNAGNKHTNYHGTPRPVYRIVRVPPPEGEQEDAA